MTLHAHLTFARVSNRFSARLMVLICEYIDNVFVCFISVIRIF